MAEASGAKKKKVRSTEDVINTAMKGRTRGKTETKTEGKETNQVTAKKFADIEDNPFYKIIFAEGDPEVKKEAVAKMLAYDLAKEKAENKQSLAEFELFKEWLMEQRKDMAQQIIKLTDTDAFSELKDVFDDLNQGLLDFENQMSPLTDILDAVYNLRMAADGTMFDVFREIQEDKLEEERIATLRAEQDKQLEQYEKDTARVDANISFLKNDKSWFGLGGIRKESAIKLAEEQTKKQRINTEIGDLTEEIANTKSTRTSEFAEYAEEKSKLRQLLDISSEQHKARQQALVDSANNFVDTADVRTSSVLVSLEGINGQIDKLADSNTGFRNVYAVISEAVQEAEEINVGVRDSLTSDVEETSNIAKMKRENNKMAVEEHVTALTAAKVDTLGTFGDLTAESYRIKSMKDANNSQVSKTRSLNSKGVAGVASRLSTVLQGVSMAALTESSEVAQITLERMNDQTNEMSHKEALKNAMGINLENDALVKAIEELESYGKVARAATDISREGYTEMKENLAELEKTARSVSDAVKDAVAVGAEVMQGDTPTSASVDDVSASEEKPSDSNPFSKLV